MRGIDAGGRALNAVVQVEVRPRIEAATPPPSRGVRAIQHRLSTRQREIFAEALMLAVERDWVVEIDEPGQGEARRVLRQPAS